MISLMMILFSFAGVRYNFIVLMTLITIITLMIKSSFSEKGTPFMEGLGLHLSSFGVVTGIFIVFLYFN